VDVGPERTLLSVCDDGAGFDVDEARRRSGRLGLVPMRERAEGIGASLEIESSPAGTSVRVELANGAG
jgi:signal transduction histidine kinase